MSLKWQNSWTIKGTSEILGGFKVSSGSLVHFPSLNTPRNDLYKKRWGFFCLQLYLKPIHLCVFKFLHSLWTGSAMIHGDRHLPYCHSEYPVIRGTLRGICQEYTVSLWWNLIRRQQCELRFSISVAFKGWNDGMWKWWCCSIRISWRSCEDINYQVPPSGVWTRA